MAPPRHPPPPTEQQQAAAAAAAAAAAVRLPDFHADSPQSWFTNLDSQFATANITQNSTGLWQSRGALHNQRQAALHDGLSSWLGDGDT